MKVQNMLAISDEEFLAGSIRSWQEALRRRDWIAFKFWAVHSFCFARTLKRKPVERVRE